MRVLAAKLPIGRVNHPLGGWLVTFLLSINVSPVWSQTPTQSDIRFDRGRIALSASPSWLPIMYHDEEGFQFLMLFRSPDTIMSFFATRTKEEIGEDAGTLIATNLEMLSWIKTGSNDGPTDLTIFERGHETDARRSFDITGETLKTPLRTLVGQREVNGWWVTGSIVANAESFSADEVLFEKHLTGISMHRVGGGLSCANLTLFELAPYFDHSNTSKEQWQLARGADKATCVDFALALAEGTQKKANYEQTRLARDLLQTSFLSNRTIESAKAVATGNALAMMHLNWEGGVPDLALAYRTLTKHASAGDAEAQRLLADALRNDVNHAPNYEASGAWEHFGRTGVRIPPSELDVLALPGSTPTQRSGHFTSCPGELGRLPVIAKRFRNLADAAASDPGQLRRFSDDLGLTFNQTPPVTTVSHGLSAAEAFQLLSDAFMDLHVLPAPWLKNTSVSLYTDGVPVSLIAALLAEQLGIVLECHGPYVRLVTTRSPPDRPQMTTVHTGILMERLVNDTGIVEMLWSNDMRYIGEARGEIPHGQGLLQFAERIQMEGEFDNGQLEGGGKIVIYHGENEVETLRGEFVGGVLHGEGHRQTNHLQYSGHFELGQFTGEGHTAMGRHASGPYKYQGQIVDDLAHGLGHCSNKYFEYPCRYYQGILVEIDGVSLLP
ncbi:MAG: hypothetical protein AB8B96_13350 [Lysobacterales bacterium]